MLANATLPPLLHQCTGNVPTVLQSKQSGPKGSQKANSAVSVYLNTRYAVVKDCCMAASYTPVETNEDDWTLHWLDTGCSIDRVLAMLPYQKINHFPQMSEICRKDNLARNLGNLRKLFPKQYKFFPRTWLPNDWESFKMAAQSNKYSTFIAKPDQGCQGRGIFVFKDASEISPAANTIIQSYIDRPLLLDGFKFDLRIYVLITSIEPLRIFIYRDGLARFATEKYTNTDCSDVRMHLTNYAINKDSSKFDPGNGDGTGSKRTTASVFKALQDQGFDVAKIWSSIDDVIIKTVLVVEPHIKQALSACRSSSSLRYGSKCFEILGFDILLEECKEKMLKPWVLEVNHSPSFTCDTSLDLNIKQGVISDALRLVRIDPNTRQQWFDDEKDKLKRRLFNASGKKNSVGSESTKENEDDHKRKLEEFEDLNMGAYRRIFPPTNLGSQKEYDVYREAAGNLYSNTASTKARQEFMRKKHQQQKEIQEAKQLAISRWTGQHRSLDSLVESRYGNKLKDKMQPIRLPPLRKTAVTASMRTLAKVAVKTLQFDPFSSMPDLSRAYSSRFLDPFQK